MSDERGLVVRGATALGAFTCVVGITFALAWLLAQFVVWISERGYL